MNQEVERLKFIARVVQKKIDHLNYTSVKVFDSIGFDERIKSLDNDPDFAETLEAYSSRFCRLQDTVGDKLLPAFLSALQEPVKSAIDNLDKAEKLGFLDSADDWIEIRLLRNKMVHEYFESIEIFAEALTSVNAYQKNLIAFAENMIRELK